MPRKITGATIPSCPSRKAISAARQSAGNTNSCTVRAAEYGFPCFFLSRIFKIAPRNSSPVSSASSTVSFIVRLQAHGAVLPHHAKFPIYPIIFPLSPQHFVAAAEKYLQPHRKISIIMSRIPLFRRYPMERIDKTNYYSILPRRFWSAPPAAAVTMAPSLSATTKSLPPATTAHPEVASTATSCGLLRPGTAGDPQRRTL